LLDVLLKVNVFTLARISLPLRTKPERGNTVMKLRRTKYFCPSSIPKITVCARFSTQAQSQKQMQSLPNANTQAQTQTQTQGKTYRVPPGVPNQPIGPGKVIKFYPPPSDPTRIIAVTDEVKAALDVINELTLPELTALADEIRMYLGKTEYEWEKEYTTKARLLLGSGNKYFTPLDGVSMPSTSTTTATTNTSTAQTSAEPPAEKLAGAKEDAKGKEKLKGPPPKEEKVLANVKLISYPDGAKMNVLREVRKVKPGMNLMDSKKLVENLPQILSKGASPEEQKQWKEALEKVGAVVEFS